MGKTTRVAPGAGLPGAICRHRHLVLDQLLQLIRNVEFLKNVLSGPVVCRFFIKKPKYHLRKADKYYALTRERKIYIRKLLWPAHLPPAFFVASFFIL
ncbi:hypothetical protein WKH50_02990 [Pantoea agglomerans]|jgi:hypothetical protein